MHNSDVEDVLFSIRRLVADKPETADQEPADATSDEPSSPLVNADPDGALFLTSSLRVGEGVADMPEVNPDPAMPLSHETAESPKEPEPTADPIASALTSSVEDMHPEPDDDIAQEEIEELAAETIQPRVYTGEPDPDAPVALDVPQPPLRPETDVTELWSLVVDSDPVIAEMQDPAAPYSASDSSDAEDAVVDTTPAVFVPKARASIKEHTASEVAQIDSDPEDDVDLADLKAPEIDEDTIRDIVEQVVREELSGVMGERITRNIRKLVRREIHRAMVARDFD